MIEWASACSQRGMEIHASKTMDITKGIKRRLNTEWEGEKMEQVEENEYLGKVISADGVIDIEINNRVQKSNQVYCQINQAIVAKKEINKNTKTRI